MLRQSPRPTAVPTLPACGKSAEIFPLIRGGPVFVAVTHPPRKSQFLPQEKLRKRRCRQFAARLSHAVNVRRGSPLTTWLKRLAFHGIPHPTARQSERAASPHAAQVLQATMDFGACESANGAMRIKLLKRRAFSQASARQKPRTAFGLPQRA